MGIEDSFRSLTEVVGLVCSSFLKNEYATYNRTIVLAYSSHAERRKAEPFW